MQTIHLKADNLVINELLDTANLSFELESEMINQALQEEKDNKIFTHDEIWDELLK